jgi:hypothetical protein
VNRLTLQERAEVAKACWPDTSAAYLMNKAALVADVELGIGTPTLSRKEQEQIRVEIARVAAWRL